MQALTHFFKKPYLSYAIVLIAFCSCIYYYYPYVTGLACGDLGLKVAGSKQMAKGKDAYFAYDSGNVKIVSGLVSTPFINILHRPLTTMSPCNVRLTWFWVQFAFFAVCIFFVFWLTGDPWKRYIQCAVLVLFFIPCRYWFLNLARGQIYIVYTFLLFLFYYLRVKKLDFIFGFVLVVAIAARPLFLMPSILLLLFHFNKSMAKGLAAAFVCMLLFTVVTKSFGYWVDYMHAMKYYSEEIPTSKYHIKSVAAIHFKGYKVPLNDEYYNCRPAIPEVDIYHSAPGSTAGLIKSLQAYFITQLHVVILNTAFFSVLALGLSLLVIWFAKKKYLQLSPEKYIILFFLVYLIAEICIPAPRSEYNFVYWIFGTAIVIANGGYIEISLILLALVLNNTYPKITAGKECVEVLMMLACFIFLFKNKKTITANTAA